MRIRIKAGWRRRANSFAEDRAVSKEKSKPASKTEACGTPVAIALERKAVGHLE